MPTHLSPRATSNELSLFEAVANSKANARAKGLDLISLDVGSPDLPPAKHIVDALNRESHKVDRHGYNSVVKSKPLRDAFAAFYEKRFGVSLNPDTEIAPLLGANEGIHHLSAMLLDSGDVALVPDPGFTSYAACASMAGGDNYFVPLTPENNWLPDLYAIPKNVLQRAKLLWLNYPNNPTASIATLDFFERAAAFCRANDIVLCHDNAYSENTFDEFVAPSLMQARGAKENCVELFTLSKAFNMAGYRVGAMVGKREIVEAMVNWKSNADSGHSLLIQAAGIEALLGDQTWVATQQELVYKRRRNVCVSALCAAGIEAVEPRATFYVWAKIPNGETSSLSWASRLLEQTGVAIMPGVCFGKQGEGWFRVSLVAPEARIAEAMERIQSTAARN
jgi:LL-diaminopimelate aminotransferase